MAKHYQDLGVYSDLPAAAKRANDLYPIAKPGKKTQKLVKEWLSFEPAKPKPKTVTVEKTWEKDGLEGELVTWSVGFGPRTEAWVIKPAGAKGKLPGAIALHDHGGFKYFAKDKVAMGPDKPGKLMRDWHDHAYGGRPFADELARRGFVVVVPDVFTWGSRRFPLETITEWDRLIGDALHEKTPWEPWPGVSAPADISRYAWAATAHEHTVEKYCQTLGTSMSGVISFEDRVAAAYLTSRKDVKAGSIGCVGLSGGGLRAGLMQATCKEIGASVVAGMMSTYADLLDHNVVTHTWMLYPTPALARQGDWPDLVACRAPSPLMVHYDEEDALFTMKGMKAADKRLKDHYKSVGAGKNYQGCFFPGPHKFDVPMQDVAFDWMTEQLA